MTLVRWCIGRETANDRYGKCNCQTPSFCKLLNQVTLQLAVASESANCIDCKSSLTCFVHLVKNPILGQTVDGQKLPGVHRRLICQKVSVSRNFSHKVLPFDT